MEKRVIWLAVLSLLISINLLSAIDLEVSSKTIQNSFITEFNDPVFFDVTIKNKDSSDSFRIYSAAGIDIMPADVFFIEKGQSKTLRINATPYNSLIQNKGVLIFEYIIQNSAGEIVVDKLGINIISLIDSFFIQSGDITTKSDKVGITIKNLLNKDFNNVQIKMNSPFFDYETELPLNDVDIEFSCVGTSCDIGKTKEAGIIGLITPPAIKGVSKALNKIGPTAADLKIQGK